MPTVYLCEINHEAYNLGRLLSVLATLQKKAHKRNESEKGLEGPGVVERYYGAASTALATVFGVLWKLHVHHFRKLEQSEKGRATAYHIRGRLAEIIGQFAPGGPGQPPRFRWKPKAALHSVSTSKWLPTAKPSAKPKPNKSRLINPPTSPTRSN